MKTAYRPLAVVSAALMLTVASMIPQKALATEGSLSWTVSGHNAFARGNGKSAVGVGSYLFGDIQITPWMSWGLGVGYTSYFTKPTNASASILDVGGRLFPFKAGPKGQFYLQGGVGIMPSNTGIDPSGAKVHGTAGLGYRLKAKGNMSVDFGLDYNVYSPRTAPTQDAELRVGLAWAFGKSKQAAPKKTTSAPPAVSGTRKAAYAQGVAAYKAQNFPTAVKYFQQAVADPAPKDVTYANACALLGAIYQYKGTKPGHLDIARKYYQDAIQVEPTNTVAIKGLESVGKLTATPAGKTPPPTASSTSMKAVYQQGTAAYKVKDYAKAEAFFKQAIQIKDPSTADFYYAEANSLLGAISMYIHKEPDHLEVARKYYQAALKIDPKTESAITGMKKLDEKK